MNTAVKPWVPTELAADTKKTSLVDQICKVFKMLWDEDTDDTRALATSTDHEDAVEGSVTIDKVMLASAVRRLARDTMPGSDLAEASIGDITRVMHHAQKRFGVDRVAIAAKKAEFLAIQGAEPAAPVEESGPNTRRPQDGEPATAED